MRNKLEDYTGGMTVIRTSEEYANACRYIENDMDMYDFKLSDKMVSYEYNLYLQDAEYFLDILYEKIRNLEDLCEYMDTYVKKKIDDENKHMDQSLLKIQTAIDKYLDINSISCFPEWKTYEAIKDRDGNTISQISQEDNMLCVNNVKNNFVGAQSILKVGPNIAHSSGSINTDKDNYMSVYNNNSCDTITETIKVIPDASGYNSVAVDPINCNIDIQQQKDGTLLLILKADKYNKTQEAFDYDNYSNSNLNKLRKTDYSYNSAQSLCDNINGLLSDVNNNKKSQYYRDIVEHQKNQDVIENKSEALDAYA